MKSICPSDNFELRPQMHGSIAALSCWRCGGCWLSGENVGKAFGLLPGAEPHREQFYERVRREARTMEYACVQCATPLWTIEHRGVEIEVCPRCSGVWFDGGELRRFFPAKGNPLSPGVAAGAAALGAAGLAGAAYGHGAERAGSRVSSFDGAECVGDALGAGEGVANAIALIASLCDGLGGL